MTFPTALSFSGNWKITVESKESTNEQRFVTSGSANDATVAGEVGQSLDVIAIPGVPWTLKIQNRQGSGPWLDSGVLMGPLTKTATASSRTVYGEDLASGSHDFNDLVVTLTRPEPSPLYLDARAIFEIPQYAQGVELRTQLRDENGHPVALEAFDPEELLVLFALSWIDAPTPAVIHGPGNPGVGRIVDAAAGVIGYTVQPNDFVRIGKYEGEFWIARPNPSGPPEPPVEAFAYPVRKKLDIRVFKTIGGNMFPPEP